MTYFDRTYARAHLRVDIAGLDVEAAAGKLKEAVEELTEKAAAGSEGGESEPGLRADGASRVETKDEAVGHLREAFDDYVTWRLDDGLEVASPARGFATQKPQTLYGLESTPTSSTVHDTTTAKESETGHAAAAYERSIDLPPGRLRLECPTRATCLSPRAGDTGARAASPCPARAAAWSANPRHLPERRGLLAERPGRSLGLHNRRLPSDEEVAELPGAEPARARSLPDGLGSGIMSATSEKGCSERRRTSRRLRPNGIGIRQQIGSNGAHQQRTVLPAGVGSC